MDESVTHGRQKWNIANRTMGNWGDRTEINEKQEEPLMRLGHYEGKKMILFAAINGSRGHFLFLKLWLEMELIFFVRRAE